MASGQLVSVEEMARQLEIKETNESKGTFSIKYAWDFGAFAVTVRGFGTDTDTHPLTPCVLEPVRHVHLYFKRRSSDPDAAAWSKIHIGTYTSATEYRTCIVVFDSQNKGVCVKLCEPDLTRLDEIRVAFAKAIRNGAARGNINISWSLALTAAIVLMTVSFAAL
jgi:hypothetical protein